MNAVPAGFARTTLELHGATGQAWLEQLPDLLDRCQNRWSLTLLPAFEPLSYNYVAPAIRADGADVVLKVGVPNPELLTEMEALRRYAGRGMVQLLDADLDQGVLLLERLLPGTPLIELEDDREATAIAAHVMQQLWRPVETHHPFPTVGRWAQGLQRLRRRYAGGTGPLPGPLVDRAEAIFAELIPSMAEPVLLHGDLHHWNILAAQRASWLALDPKGVVGEPAYEVGAWLRNPLPQLLQRADPRAEQARRLDQFSELLGLDRQRLLKWGVAQAVLSAWWSIEDHGDYWQPAIACAELLAQLL